MLVNASLMLNAPSWCAVIQRKRAKNWGEHPYKIKGDERPGHCKRRLLKTIGVNAPGQAGKSFGCGKGSWFRIRHGASRGKVGMSVSSCYTQQYIMVLRTYEQQKSTTDSCSSRQHKYQVQIHYPLPGMFVCRRCWCFFGKPFLPSCGSQIRKKLLHEKENVKVIREVRSHRGKKHSRHDITRTEKYTVSVFLAFCQEFEWP